MGLFDIFKKKEKTYICARCKKEITDEESKWIGNHRFCADCAAPPKNATKPVNNVPQKQDKHSDYEKNKRICLCYHKANEYELYQVELQFNENDEILIVDTYFWPTHRGAFNGGQATTKLDSDYFTKNTIDDFIVFLRSKYKLAVKFNQDFSALKNRDDINALFRRKNEIIFKMITLKGQSHNFSYLYHTRYSPNRSSACGYGSDDWMYLCEENGKHYLLTFSDVAGYGTAWMYTELIEGDCDKLKNEDVNFWSRVAYSKERNKFYGVRLTNIENVRHLLPTDSRCVKLTDEHYLR